MNYPKILIIVLNWNGKEDTLECLESVCKIVYPNFEVIVIDNGSSDDSVQAVRDSFPEVTVLETNENLGFAGGNNSGIRYALKNGADYIFLLNNDTIVDPHILNQFIKVSKTLGDQGILGAKIYYFSEPEKIWYAGAKWVKNYAKFIHVGHGCLDNGRSFTMISETDYACGCAFFVSSRLIRTIGMFDERFFLTFEETDLCYRAKKAGYKSYFVPGAKVWHKISSSFGGEKSALYTYFLMRNRLLWAEKNLPYPERMILYKHVMYELVTSILPPRFRFHRYRTANSPVMERITRFCLDYKKSFMDKRDNPVIKAKLLGVRDYLLRRLGNCSESIRSLGK